MKRVLMNCKRVVAAVTLCMIVVCGFSSVSQAGVSVEAGRQRNGDKYRSVTKVYAYEDNGVAKKVKVTARIRKNYSESSGQGYAIARTEWTSPIADAWHVMLYHFS